MKSKIISVLMIMMALFAYFYFDLFSSLPIGDRLSNKQAVKTGTQLGQKYNMYISCLGGGATSDGKIRLISVGFHRHGKPLTLDEGRKLLVACCEKYLSDINHNEKLKLYLNDFPFTAKNLCIYIIHHDEQGKTVYDPYLGSMSMAEGQIDYETEDPENEYKYKSEFSETYEEAVALLQKEKIEQKP